MHKYQSKKKTGTVSDIRESMGVVSYMFGVLSRSLTINMVERTSNYEFSGFPHK